MRRYLSINTKITIGIIIAVILSITLLIPSTAFAETDYEVNTENNNTISESATNESIMENDDYNDITESATPKGEVGAYWRFKKSSENKYFSTGRTKKVSADFAPGFTCSISTTKTFTASFSTTLSSSFKSLMTASASAAVAYSKS